MMLRGSREHWSHGSRSEGWDKGSEVEASRLAGAGVTGTMRPQGRLFPGVPLKGERVGLGMHGVRRGAQRCDCGSGSLISLGLVIAILLVAATIGVVAVWAMAHEKAEGVADMTALAAAQEAVTSTQETAVCQVARDVASANGASVSSCSVVWALDLVGVKIVVTVPISWSIPGLPTSIEATAYAGNPPD